MSGEDDPEDATQPVVLPPLLPDTPSADLSASPSSPALDAQRLQPPSGADAQRLQSHSPTEAQRLQSHPQTDAQRLGQHPQTEAQRLGHQPSTDAQRLGHQPSTDAQRAQTSSADVHRGDPMQQRGDAQRTFSRGKLRAIRRGRPRMIAGLVAAAAAAATTLVIINTQRDDEPAVVSPATVVTVPSPPSASAVVVTTAAAPPATARPAPTTALPTTALPTTALPTTVVETTTTFLETTVPTTVASAAASGAGTYLVTVTENVLHSAETGDIATPQQPSELWTLEGPCDGIGTCTMAYAGSAIGGGPPGGHTSVVMSPAGPNAYSGTQDLNDIAAGCGNGSAVFMATLAPGSLSGSYLASFTGGGDCGGPFTVSSKYSGVLNG
jgi:hypothetical protein